MNDYITFIDSNVRGAIVIYGILGIRQYYGYSRDEACQRYLNECDERVFICVPIA